MTGEPAQDKYWRPEPGAAAGASIDLQDMSARSLTLVGPCHQTCMCAGTAQPESVDVIPEYRLRSPPSMIDMRGAIPFLRTPGFWGLRSVDISPSTRVATISSRSQPAQSGPNLFPAPVSAGLVSSHRI